MFEIIGVVLAMLTGLFIAYPFLQKRQRQVSFADNHRAEELEARKAQIYAAIKDIDFDFQMGKLSKEDYEQLRSEYKVQAVGLLKQLDQMQGKRRGGPGAAIKFCHECGQPLTAGNKFCSACGEKV
jgi:membrane protease subunit (stomatin/prohibitin family)